MVVRSVPDGRDKIKAVREKTAAGEERLRGGAAWLTARKLAGEDKPDESDHHLTRGRYQKKEEDEASSPSSKMEAESSHGRCAAAEGGRRFPVYGGDHERANQSTKKKRERFGISERTTWSSYDGLWRGSSGGNSESTATAAA